MLIKFTFVNLLMAFVCHFSTAFPLEMENEEDAETFDTNNIENVFYEIRELKRITRQCPFSGGRNGGANGQGPDVQQMISIARTVLNALDSNGAGGVGGPPKNDVETNQLSRFRQRG